MSIDEYLYKDKPSLIIPINDKTFKQIGIAHLVLPNKSYITACKTKINKNNHHIWAYMNTPIYDIVRSDKINLLLCDKCREIIEKYEVVYNL